MRAISDNPDLAASTGIDVDRTVTVVWFMAGTLVTLGAVFQGLTEQVQWQMGNQILLMVFAAVTLGGLGTAYGAMVGSIVVGVLINVAPVWTPPGLDDPVDPRRDEERRRADRDDHRADDPAAGHLRAPGEGRLTWTGGRSSRTRCVPASARRWSIYALAAIGLNLHFGYTGLLNFGQVGFMAVGAYGLGITTAHVRQAAVDGHPRRAGRRRRARPAARRADAATAGRLPRDRHDRLGRDHPIGGPGDPLPSDVRRLQRPPGHRPRVPGHVELHLGAVQGATAGWCSTGSTCAFRGGTPVGDARRLDPRRRRRRLDVAAGVEPVGTSAAGRSARTRPPPDRSARTCSGSACSR